MTKPLFTVFLFPPYVKLCAIRDNVLYIDMEIDGRKVNGSQTVTENIADLGAVACITQIAADVHAPEKIRVNAPLSAQQDFRDLYGITKGDGMYHEMMPKIW